jgi:hypothetical protein
MNPYGSVQVPDRVPDEWQQRFGSARIREEADGRGDDDIRARAIVTRLLIWVGVVTTTGAVVMWPATYLPPVLAAAVFVGLGVVAVLVFARWVLRAADVAPGPKTAQRRR